MESLVDKVVVIAGAGSGVGQAVAWQLGAAGAKVALLGRTADALQQTAGRLEAAKTLVYPGDISKADEVAGLRQAVQERFGRVDVLVNAAGINVPRRALGVLSLADFQQIIEVNLTGAFIFIQAFLPVLRAQGSGTIINIASVAGLQASELAGAAYASSKFGMRGLTQAINAEEQSNGIRACAIFPGDINTPLLDRRPAPPSTEARQKMLQGEDLAACVALVAQLPAHAVVEEIVIRPART